MSNGVYHGINQATNEHVVPQFDELEAEKTGTHKDLSEFDKGKMWRSPPGGRSALQLQLSWGGCWKDVGPDRYVSENTGCPNLLHMGLLLQGSRGLQGLKKNLK